MFELSGSTVARLVAVIAAVGCGWFAVAVVSPPAAAQISTGPCWHRLLNDWYDGAIDARYSVACYRGALLHLSGGTKTGYGPGAVKADIASTLSVGISRLTKHGVLVGPQTLVPSQKSASPADRTDTDVTRLVAVALVGLLGLLLLTGVVNQIRHRPGAT